MSNAAPTNDAAPPDGATTSGTGSTNGAADPRLAAGRFAVTSAVGLAGLVLGGLLLAALLWALAGPLVAFDRAVAAGFNGVVAPRPWLVAVLGTATKLGDTVTGVVVLATLAVALLIRRRARLALFALVAGIGGLVLGPLLKELVGRLRPTVEVPVATAPGWSFPSGHTLCVTLWVGVVLLVLLPAVPTRARRPVIGVGVAVVVLVGLTRVALGVHYLSDVVAGWLLGAAWLAVATAAFRAWRRSDGRTDTSLVDGLAPEAAADLAPAPDHGTAPDHLPTRIAQLLVVAVVLLAVMVGLGWLLTATEAGSVVDDADVAAVQWLADHRTPTLDAVSDPADELGNTLVVISLGAVAAVLGMAVLRHVRPLVVLAVGLVGQLVLFVASSLLVGRQRPPVEHLDEKLPPTSSFPSGHTGAAIALYGGIALLVFGATRAWWRWLVVAVAVVVVVVVAVARLYRGAHHPSDVTGSLLLSLPWLLAVMHLIPDPSRELTGRRPAR